jgi:uncharacterized membrane protein YbhN (UPF0104 family)
VALSRQWGTVGDSFGRFSLAGLVVAFGAVAAGLFCSAAAWRAVVRGFGSPIGHATAIRVFFVGQLGKYVPGSVWAVVAQVQLARRHGVSRAGVGAAALLVMVLNTLTGVLVGFGLLPFGDHSVLSRYAWLLLVVPVGLAALHPRALRRLLRAAAAVTRVEAPAAEVPARAIGAAVAWTLAMWAAYGAQVWVLVRDLGGSGATMPLTATGAFALAWVAGFVLLVAPAGVGARELVLVVALTPALGSGRATALALVSRLLMTLGDLCWGAVALATGRASGSAGPLGTTRSGHAGTADRPDAG